MKKFEEFVKATSSLLEKLITFGNKAYPKFGHVVILAGGAGSGKGFQLKNLLGIEGKTFDVDELKTLALKSNKIAGRVKTEYGVDLQDLDLKNPDNVSVLHEILSDELNLSDRRRSVFYSSILASSKERKPNLIFDVTLKNLRKLETITRNVQKVGYLKENIHIVWIVNEIDVAIKQNLERDRNVPEEILVNTHQGVSMTMNQILNMGDDLQKYMNGDIYISFNKKGADIDLKTSDKGGKWIKDADYVKVKEAGKPQKPSKEIDKDVYRKIQQYVPKQSEWD